MSFIFLCFGLGLAVIYLFLLSVLWLTHEDQEPALLFDWIPFISPIIGILTKRWRYFLALGDQYSFPIRTVRLPWYRVYVVSDSSLVRAVDRQIRTISFAPIEANATAGFLGTTEITNEIMRRDPSGDKGHFHTFHEAIRPALSPGPGIDSMLKKTFDAMDASMRGVNRGYGEPIGLFQWIRHEIILATTTGEYGPANPFLDPEVEKSWYEFLHGVPFFASGFFPNVFARKSFKARESLASRFEKYFRENHHLNGGSSVLRSRQAHGIATGLPDCDRARGEIGSAMALLNNIVPSACWLVYHIFSEPAILETCRHQLSQAVMVETDGTRTLDLRQVKSHCPILLSTLNEVYRYYGVATVLVREVVEDHMLNKAYLLKKGSFVLMPTSAQHFSQAEWGPDANRFKHDRFINEKGSSDPSKRHHTSGLRVFGGGALLCPGRHLANDVILSFAAMMILRFDLRPIHGDPPFLSNHWDDLKAENSFGVSIARVILQPEKDLQVEMVGSKGFARDNDAPWRLRLSDSGDHVDGGL